MTIYRLSESIIIERRFGAGDTDHEIAQSLLRNGHPQRSDLAVAKHRRKLGLLRLHDTVESLPSDAPTYRNPSELAARMAGELAFAKAMLAARKAGTGSERRVTLGPITDDRPLAPHKIYPEPQGSCCGSAAAQCLEIGDREVWGAG